MKLRVDHLFIIAGLFVLSALSAPSSADHMVPAKQSAAAQKSGFSILDGRTYRGEIGAINKPAFSEDVWVFEDGMFASKECVKCGFPKGKYWVSFSDEGIRFRTHTVCPVTEAKIVYDGVVNGDRMEGTYTWTKERWYWTIEKKFWFEGDLVRSPDVAAAIPQ